MKAEIPTQKKVVGIDDADVEQSKTSRRIFFGILTTFLGQIIVVGQPILLVPLFIHAWTADGYGRWLSLTALISYLSLLDFGGQSYIGNLLAIDYARGAVADFRKKLSEAISLFLFIALSVFVLLVTFLFGLQELVIPGLNRPLLIDERLIILFLATSFLISIPTGVYTTVYRSTGMYVRSAWLGNIVRLAQLLVFSGLLLLKVNPVIYAASYTIFAAVIAIMNIWDSQRKIVACQYLIIGVVQAWNGRLYLGGALRFWFIALATAANQQGILLVLAAFASPAVVVIYATHRTAAGLVGYVNNVVFSPLWSELSFMWAKGQFKELQLLLLLLVKGLLVVSGMAALLIWVLLPSVYATWTGRDLKLYPLLLAILLVQTVLSSGWYTAGWVLYASNLHSKPALWSLANAFVTVVLALWLVPKYGVDGAAFATLLGDILCGLLVFPILSAQSLKIRVSEFYWSMLKGFIILFPLIGVVLVYSLFLQGWFLITAYMITLILWSAPALYLVLGKSQARGFIQLIRGKLKVITPF